MGSGQEFAGAADGGLAHGQANLARNAASPGMSGAVTVYDNQIGFAGELIQGLKDYLPLSVKEQTRNVRKIHRTAMMTSLHLL
jgi:hypothetical protein